MGNNPLRYTDSSGHCPWCIAAAVGAATGAIVGAASVAVPQMIHNVQAGQPLMANINPTEVGKAAAAGAAAGAVAGATFGLGTAVLGTGLAGTVASGALSGAEARQVGVVAENALSGRNLATGLSDVKGVASAAVLSAATAGLGYGAASLFQRVRPVSQPLGPDAIGRAGEEAVGITGPKERIPSLTGTANYRIPDALDKSARKLIEVKNVSQLSYTRQLQDFNLWAQQKGYAFELYVRQTTKLSGPLQSAIDNGEIILRYLPW